MDKIIIKNQLNPIKQMRLERGLKQIEMEALTGISQARISRFEINIQKPTDDELRLIGAAFLRYKVI